MNVLRKTASFKVLYLFFKAVFVMRKVNNFENRGMSLGYSPVLAGFTVYVIRLDQWCTSLAKIFDGLFINNLLYGKANPSVLIGSFLVGISLYRPFPWKRS